ncbi:MAG: PorV/PorQ family protein [Elusimicrobiota bacterium]|nr:PorV/PorQ family protein [Elusimicrobiota bacterium]
MKYKKFIKIILYQAIFLGQFCVLYAKSAGTTSAEFLKLSYGTRPSSLGETYVAIANDSSAIFWNPAGLSLVTWNELLASYNSWIQDIKVGSLSYAMPFGQTGSLGVGVMYLNSGSIMKREETKEEIGSYDVKNTGLSVGYGSEFFQNISLGVSLKYLSEKIDSESGTGFAADIGGLYMTQINDMPLNFGISLLNLGGSMGPGDKSDLPKKLKAGFSLKLFEEKVTANTEVDYPFISDMTAGRGFEYMLSEIFVLRLGYKLFRDDLTGIEPVTFGFGIVYSQKQDFIFDYAFSNAGDLGYSNKASAGVRF